MHLENILLGVLREPAAGYDVKQMFDRVFSHFWAADMAQIYRTLNRLEERGLLRSWSEPSDKGPERRVYQRTADGEAELIRWLSEGPVFGTERFTYVAQVFFLGEAADLDLTERFLQGIRDTVADRLQTIEDIDAGWSRMPGYPDDMDAIEFHRHLTMTMGLHKYRAIVTWADESLARVRERRKAQTEKEAHDERLV